MNRRPAPEPLRGAMLARLARGFAVLRHALLMASGIGIVLLMALTVADVGRRQATGSSIPGAVEIIEVLMVLVVFAAIGPAEHDGTHVRSPMLTSRVPEPVALTLRAAGSLFVVVLLAVVLQRTVEIGVASFEAREVRMGLLAIPIWPAKIAVPVGLGILLLEHLVRLSRTLIASRVPGAGAVGPEVLEAPLPEVNAITTETKVND